MSDHLTWTSTVSTFSVESGLCTWIEFITRPSSDGFPIWLSCRARHHWEEQNIRTTASSVTPRCTAFARCHSRASLLPAKHVSPYSNSDMLLFRQQRLQSDTLITSSSILSCRYRPALLLPAVPLPANRCLRAWWEARVKWVGGLWQARNERGEKGGRK